MIPKDFDEIGKADIDALVSAQVPEGRTIEYKELLPGNADADKKEFLADITSFANASGGDIVYGVRGGRDANGNPNGLPQAAIGIAGLNADTEKLRLESLILSGIGPRIVPAVQAKPLQGFAQGPVLLVRIPKSWNSPHMVTFQNHSRFYSRHSGGKYAMDVTQIRSAFALSESLPERIRGFRDGRLAKIVSGETPVPLFGKVRIVLHVMPLSALDGKLALDLRPFDKDPRPLAPIYTDSFSRRYNFDGLVVYMKREPPTQYLTYVQLFRHGAIEAVDGVLLARTESPLLIPYITFEDGLIKSLGRYLKVFRDSSIQLPVFVMLSLLGVRGYGLRLQNQIHFESDRFSTIDRDALLLPDMMVESYAVRAETILKPAFDAVWQGCGWDRCRDYDEQGNWIGRVM